jgi:hypothetical protein
MPQEPLHCRDTESAAERARPSAGGTKTDPTRRDTARTLG